MNLEGRELVITTISFQPEVIQIGFFERGDQSEDGGLEKMLTVSTEDYESLIDEIQTAVTEDIIEDYFLKNRNPPDTLPAAESRLTRITNRDESSD